MFSGFGTRLGQTLAEKIAERFKSPPTPAEEAPAEAPPPAVEAAAGEMSAPPPADALPTETAPAQSMPITEVAAPFESAATPVFDAVAPRAATVEQPVPAQAPPADLTVVPTSYAQADPATAASPSSRVEPVGAATAPVETQPTEAQAAAPVESWPTEAQAAAAAPSAPEKSAEEIEEERLWGETDRAWAAGDFGRVTELLDQLKVLQPEDAAEIDQKIAAAQYNAGSHFEQTGELARALYLYQDAQRRDPNLGEANFAIERVQNLLVEAARPIESTASAPAPTARTYTVEGGDSLWAIAERFYGNGGEWGKILEANRDQIQNPDMIQPGQVLTIP